ncbi:hypothetical protein GCM10009557_37210 [Virgisporangium ochraceum]|uniref:Uncharacterized protein n=1 Tax=Virgisporangium ochraceum TaxID=65505 RepID=A0A8J4EGP2_9ACTN|nr:hypothetical protein [Virgisporangium ochraceum]GIJ73903.1 hypothetical protein Voc01_088200 [Virgisporangium ochraceum]
MSQHVYPYAPGPTPYRSSGGIPRRPLTLTLGYVGALLAGLFGAVGAAVLMLQARDVAERTVRDATEAVLGSDSGSTDILVTAAVDEAAGTLTTRGVMGLVSALLVIGVALAVRNGALWARAVLTVLLLGSLCGNGVIVADVAPAVTKALGVTAMLLGVVVVVLLFLPPTNRYAKARKLAAGAR